MTEKENLINDKTTVIIDKNNDSYKMYNDKSHTKALRRSFALLLTYGIEMFVAFFISQFTTIFNKYPLLISFQPVISAISGNIGLQASSINVRGIETKIVKLNCEPVLKEIFTSLWLAGFTSVIVGLTSFFWYSLSNDDWYDGIIFGIALFIGQFMASMSAAISGSFAPIIFKKTCKLDPTTMAGPLETAFQDVIGSTILLSFSAWLLTTFGRIDLNCGGTNLKNCTLGCFNLNTTYTDCISGCVTYCS